MAEPEALYKYLPPSRVDVLEGLLIRFTQASSLNDTLELHAPVKGVAESKRLEAIAREGLAPRVWDAALLDKRKILERQCPGLADLVREIYLQTYTKKAVAQIENRHQQNPQAIFDAIDQNFGILSLSEVPTDVRMWGHYADGGRGFLIEFDPQHAWFHGKRDERDSFRHIREVKYVSTRPLKFLLDLTELDFLYTKWDVWREELEWRIIRCFNDAKTKLAPDLYGNDILLFEIPPNAIKSVVLGFSASLEFITKVKLVLEKNSNLRHVVLKQAKQGVENGKVEIIQVHDPNPVPR